MSTRVSIETGLYDLSESLGKESGLCGLLSESINLVPLSIESYMVAGTSVAVTVCADVLGSSLSFETSFKSIEGETAPPR